MTTNDAFTTHEPRFSPRQEAAPLLELRDLKVWYPIVRGVLFEKHVGDVRAVDGISFALDRGQTLGLVGESGCGKSTTARAVIQLTRPTSGAILFDGVPLGRPTHRIQRRMQMVFQDPYGSLNPRLTAGAIIAEPLEIHNAVPRRSRNERVSELLATVGLPPHSADRYPHEFSGGQRQRIGVARALALNPDLIVADEPVSALDVSVQAQILNLLRRLQDELGLTYLFIAHDLSVVRYVSDRIAVMYLGKLMELGEADAITRSPVHPYSVALTSAIPIPSPRLERTRKRIILAGEIPSPANPPAGCRFHSRCWLRANLKNPEICTSDEPPLHSIGPNQAVACHFPTEARESPERARVIEASQGAPQVVRESADEATSVDFIR